MSKTNSIKQTIAYTRQKKSKLQEIVEFFGKENQINKLQEEMIELSCAITEGKLEGIIEEIADVEIMLDQIKIIFNISQEEVSLLKNYKIWRTHTRIEDGEA